MPRVAKIRIVGLYREDSDGPEWLSDGDTHVVKKKKKKRIGITFKKKSSSHHHHSSKKNKRKLTKPVKQIKRERLGINNDNVKDLERFLQSSIVTAPASKPEATEDEVGELYACKECDLVFPKRKSAIEHLSTHVKLTVYTCELCKGKFGCQEYLQKHLKDKHTVSKPDVYICPSCGKMFLDVDEHDLHLDEHISKKTFVTKSAVAPSDKNAKNHCGVCDRDFTTAGEMRKHMKTHAKKKYKCLECGSGFTKEIFLKDHEKSHKGEKQYKCGKCLLQFEKLGNFKFHLKSHEKCLLCMECGSYYEVQEQYDEHQAKHRSPVPFYCQICDMWFTSKRRLITHKHVDPETVFQCKICKATFKSGKSLRYHMDEHEGRRYECEICQVRFKCDKKLRDHEKLHTGEKNARYSCRECDIAFMRHNTWRRHMIIHRKEKCFKCFECDMAFTTKLGLHQHMRHKHRPSKNSATNNGTSDSATPNSSGAVERPPIDVVLNSVQSLPQPPVQSVPQTFFDSFPMLAQDIAGIGYRESAPHPQCWH